MADLAYLQSVARKRMAVGVLFLQQEKILLVKTTYKEGWSVPGGVVDALESPGQACLRECREELGIDITLENLAVMDWMAEPVPGGHDSMQVLFIGKPLTDAQLKAIKLPPDELEAWTLASQTEAIKMLRGNLRKRVAIALNNHNKGGVYAENGIYPAPSVKE